MYPQILEKFHSLKSPIKKLYRKCQVDRKAKPRDLVEHISSSPRFHESFLCLFFPKSWLNVYIFQLCMSGWTLIVGKLVWIDGKMVWIV
jgi:hypothetical protein